METVKTQATMGEVDVRRTLLVITNRETGEERRMAFSDFELRVGDIPIPEAAPEEVRDLLVTAKN
jgi:Pyruvate/2-oxoacid:ferredoxin oxidoreductase gamma subunit